MLLGFMLQLFWFSFAVAGFATLILCLRLGKRLGVLATNILALHQSVVLFVSLALGFGLFALPICFGYIFQTPLVVFSYLYLVVLVATVAVLYSERARVKTVLVQLRPRLSERQWWVFGFLIVIIATEYVISYNIGGPLTDDTPQHLSHIQMMLNYGHLSLSDPFNGYNGVIDLRYSTNLLNGLQAVAAKLFTVQAASVWFYSYAFYQFIIGLSIFALIKTYLGKAIPDEWPYYIVIILPYFMFTYFFDYAELPHCIAIAWTSLVFIGLKQLFVEHKAGVLFLGVILTAATHAITSTYTAAFFALVIIALLCLRKVTRKQLLVLCLAIVILAIPVVASSWLPSRSTKTYLNETDGHGFHGIDVTVKKYHGVVLPTPILVDRGISRHPSPVYVALPLDPWAIGGYALLLGYVSLIKRSKSKKLKRVSLLLVTVLSLGIFNSLYVSTVSYYYLIRKAPTKPLKWVLGLAVIFFALIAYNPIVLTIAYKRVPLWLIARFNDLNVFMFIAPLLGIFLLYRYVARYWGIPRMASGLSLFIVMFVAGAVLFRFPFNSERLISFNQSSRHNNQLDYATLADLRQIDPSVGGQVIFTDDADVSNWLPIATNKQIGEIVNSGSNQENNIQKRFMCSNFIYERLSVTDLQAAKITRVVLRIGYGSDRSQNELTKLASTKPYLHPLQTTAHYEVYAFDAQSADQSKVHASICDIPYRQ